MTVASNDVLQAACNGAVDRVDIGTGTAQVLIREGTTTLAAANLPNPAFGDGTAASPSVATANGLPLAFTGIADGDADNYQVTDRNGAVKWSGTAGDVGTEECVLDNANIANGQNGNVTAFTWTQPNGT